MLLNIFWRMRAPQRARIKPLRLTWIRIDRALRKATPARYSVADLRAACAVKQIRYEETPVYDKLRGVVVRYARTSIISIKESLPEPEKLVVLAHELGHVALDHTQSSSSFLLPPPDESRPFAHNPEIEQQARVWAAHLLVRSEVFERFLREAKVTSRDEKLALRAAIRQTASALNVPTTTVKLWTETRDWSFPEAPRSWLMHP